MTILTKQIRQLLCTEPDGAFHLMYQHYYKPLCCYVLKFVDNADEAEDIIQNMFIHLWHKQNHILEAENIRAYLYQSARNASLNSLRSRKDNKRLSDLDIELLDLANDSVEAASEKFDSVAQAIATLPPQCKRIFEMNRLEGYSYKEIANELNISHRTVDTHLSRAMRTLRKKLNPAHVSVIAFIISIL